jgi:hypothetical protein
MIIPRPADSDVELIFDADHGPRCVRCQILAHGESFVAESPLELSDHLDKHRLVGHRVPSQLPFDPDGPLLIRALRGDLERSQGELRRVSEILGAHDDEAMDVGEKLVLLIDASSRTIADLRADPKIAPGAVEPHVLALLSAVQDASNAFTPTEDLTPEEAEKAALLEEAAAPIRTPSERPPKEEDDAPIPEDLDAGTAGLEIPEPSTTP